MKNQNRKVPKCLKRVRKPRITNEDVEVMKIEVFAHIENELVDGGEGYDVATETARYEVERLSRNQIINAYKEMTK